METLDCGPYFETNPNQLQEVRKAYNYEDVNRLVQDIDIFEDWIKKQNHFRVREFDRGYLERFLIANKGSIERAKKRFDKQCTFRLQIPEFLQNFDIRNEFFPLRRCSYVLVLPKPTADNCRVIVSNIFGFDEKMDFVSYYRYSIVVLEYLLQKDYAMGYEAVVDTRDIPFGTVAKFNPIIISKALSLIIDTLSLRLRCIHFISGSKFLDAIVTIFKQSVSDKVAKKILIHDSIESIHKLIDKNILPIDYGGKDKTTKEYDDIFFNLLSTDEHIARMKFIESASTDEKNRLSATYVEEYSGTPGSFKTMCLE